MAPRVRESPDDLLQITPLLGFTARPDASFTVGGRTRPLTFTDTPSRCAECHQDIHRGEVGEDCAACHTERSFLDRGRMIQQHQTTRFTLEGAHRAADCESCHPAQRQGMLQFVGRPLQCDGCHAAQFAAAQSPNHVTAGFSRDCQTCHASTNWNAARFNHDRGGFPLTGAHRSVACDQCHLNNQYSGAPVACVSCHQADYDLTTSPAHGAAQFPTDCASCHGTRSWKRRSDHGQDGLCPDGRPRRPPTWRAVPNGDGMYSAQADHLRGVPPLTTIKCDQPRPPTASSFPNATARPAPRPLQWLGATFNHDATSFALTGQSPA